LPETLLVALGGLVVAGLAHFAGVARERRAQDRVLEARRRQSSRQIVTCTEAMLKVLRGRLETFRRATINGTWRAFLQIEADMLLPDTREQVLQGAIGMADTLTHQSGQQWENTINECRQVDTRHAILRYLAAVPGDETTIATKLIGYESSLERTEMSLCAGLRTIRPHAAEDTQAAIDQLLEEQ